MLQATPLNCGSRPIPCNVIEPDHGPKSFKQVRHWLRSSTGAAAEHLQHQPKRCGIGRTAMKASTTWSVTRARAAWCRSTMSVTTCAQQTQSLCWGSAGQRRGVHVLAAEMYDGLWHPPSAGPPAGKQQRYLSDREELFNTCMSSFLTSPVKMRPAAYSRPMVASFSLSSRKKLRYFQGTSTSRLAPEKNYHC